MKFQRRVDRWLATCFGGDIVGDPVERNHRFLEEALELVQACNCTKDEALALVDYVFDRGRGEIRQEVGGVLNTLAALSSAHGIDMMQEGHIEVDRCWMKIEKIRAKQAAKPSFSPLPGSYPHREYRLVPIKEEGQPLRWPGGVNPFRIPKGGSDDPS